MVVSTTVADDNHLCFAFDYDHNRLALDLDLAYHCFDLVCSGRFESSGHFAHQPNFDLGYGISVASTLRDLIMLDTDTDSYVKQDSRIFFPLRSAPSWLISAAWHASAV